MTGGRIMERPEPSRRPRIIAALIETFGFSPLLASIVALFFLLLAGAAILWLFLSAPPRTITIMTGPPGSSFQRSAIQYQERLAKRGLNLKIVPSAGSQENLQRLKDPAAGVDVAFVQGGLASENPRDVSDNRPEDLVSLGRVAYQPLWVFYRGSRKISLLSELAGKRIGIGVAGSGVQAVARTLLDMNGIANPPTTLVELAAEDAAKEFAAGRLDAIFLMGDSAPLDTLRTLIRDPGIQLYSFTQADAYVRRLPYLNRIVLPQGSIDFGANQPAQDVILIGPTVELVARKGLNSAVSDVLLSAVHGVHSRAGLLTRRGEFPAAVENEFTLSEDAVRYYKSGEGFTYKLFDSSFWIANLINRLLVAIVPMLLVLIPAIRFLPVAYRWSVQLKIYRCYRPLLRLERDAVGASDRNRVAELLARLDVIESDVNALKVPASFASQFYDLRHHLHFVRKRLQAAATN